MEENKDIFEEEVFEDEFDEIPEDVSIEQPKYELPEQIVDNVEVEGTGKKFSDLSLLDKIRFAASQNGVVIKDPNKSCNHCYGKGYVSVKTVTTSGDDGKKITEEIPNPCKCIFNKKDLPRMFTGKFLINRKTQKRMEREEKRKEVKKRIEVKNKIFNDKKRAKLKAKNKAKKKAKRKLRRK